MTRLTLLATVLAARLGTGISGGDDASASKLLSKVHAKVSGGTSRRASLRCPPGARDPYANTSWPIHPIGYYKKGRRASSSENEPLVFLEQCNPTKTGYSEMRTLLGWAVDGKFGHNGKAVLMAARCRAPSIGEAANARALSFLVVRNPYERLLSGFLAQVAARNCSAQSTRSGAQRCLGDERIRSAELELDFAPEATLRPVSRPHPHSGAGAFAGTPEGFADFVPKLLQSWRNPQQQHFRRGRNTGGATSTSIGNGFAFDHLAPISGHDHTPGGGRGCLTKAHTRGLRLSEYYNVLKLEHQGEWYPRWVEATGLTEWVNSTSRWPGGCFWKGKQAGSSCAESLQLGRGEGGSHKTQEAAALAGGGGGDGSGNVHKCAVAGGHNIGACSQLQRFYTRALADQVSTLFSNDLQEFGYPRWDPESQPTPLAGPDMSQWDTRQAIVASNCLCEV